MRTYVPLIAVCAGCAMDVLPETVIDELTVLAIAPVPPEVGPTDAIAVEVTVVDPDEEAFDVLVWLCTNTGDGCLEAGGDSPRPLWEFVAVFPAASETTSVQLPALPGLAFALTEPDTVLPLFVWALACRPGACDVFTQVDAAPAPGTPAWTALVDRLGDPRSLLDGVAIVDASLATHGVRVSNRAVRNEAPLLTVTPPGDPIGVDTDAPFVVGASEDVELFAYAVRGSWDTAQVSIIYDISAPTLQYAAPAEAGTDRLYLVAEDGDGGTALWSTVVDVTD